MFAWSRLEIWTAVILASLIVVGGTGQWLLAAKNGPGQIVVEAKPVATGGDEMTSTAGAEERGDGVEVRIDGAVEAGEGTVLMPSASSEREGAVDERININTAQPSELQRLPGIGPALAARIVQYRELWGPFDEIEDIMEVSGIGPVKFDNMKHLIKVR